MKKIFSLLLAVLMTVAALTFIPVSEATAAEDTVIKNTSPAVTGNTGEDIDLSVYTVELNDGTVLESPEWTMDGETVTTVKFDEKGVYTLTASKDGKSRTVYAVIKEPSETEYVLYENNFDSAADIEGLKKVANGDISVADGKLVMNTTGKSNTILLMPEWLADFGNYNLETSAAMISSTDASRWFSVCYRYQGSQYMHMCVRKNMANAGGEKTTGGVECVGNDGTWRYLRSAGYDTNMEYGKFYKFAVYAYENTIQYTVDDSIVIHIDDITTYGYTLKTTGNVGLQGNSSEMQFDYLKVTLATEKATKPEVKDPLIAVEHGVTNILNAVTNVANVAEADLENVLSADSKPNGVLVKYEGITAEKLDSLYEICNEKRVVPGLYVSSAEEADALVSWCSKNDFWDITVASENAEVIKAVRAKKPVIRTALYMTDTAEKTAQKIREEVRYAGASILILPAEVCSKSFVAALQELHVTVWPVDSEMSKIDVAWMISSGANGLLTDDPALVTKVMNEVYGEYTLTKTPSIIGHRGNPSQAPENSIEGYITAVQNGATEVETDIYLTSDGEIIIMHDSTLNRTTNYTGTKSVTQMTLAEIREYRLLNLDGTVSDAPVPTLKEMFEALKDYDVYYVVELKSGDENMVEPLYQLIKEYGVADRVNIISFSGPVLQKTYDVDPIISAGYLSGSVVSNADPKELRISAFSLIKSAQIYNSTVNINYGNISKDFYQILNDRGITLWPWTFNTGSSMLFYNAFLWGVDGLTTDDAQMTKNVIMDFDASLADGLNSIMVGTTLNINAETTTYGKVTESALGKVDVTWLENDIGATIDTETGVFTAGETAGKATFMLSHTTKLPNGKVYVMYSQPMTVEVTPDNSIDVVKVVCLSITAVALTASFAILVVNAVKKKKAK